MNSLTKEFPTHFVIDRNVWLRGEGARNSKLLRESDNKMCCLGQVGLACGLSEEQILGFDSLDQLVNTGKINAENIPEVFLSNTKVDEVENIYSSGFAMDLMEANDDPYATSVEREERLAKIASKEGLTFEFINGETES